MTRARGDSGLDGFINLCKPSGPTSHDAVARVRRILGTRRVGHGGTLDPLAEGVLPIALGRATRLLDRVVGSDKEYEAWALLGRRTSTDDAEGDLLSEVPVPRYTTAALETVLREFEGRVQQIPPAHSAIKVAGRRAYEAARRGEPVTVPPRIVTIEQICLRSWQWPLLRLRVICSKGTFIRSLVRDIGTRLGVGASLQRLIRTRVGTLGLGDAIDVEEIASRRAAMVLPPDALLTCLDSVVLDATELEHLRHGRAWSREMMSCADAAEARAYTIDGRFAGLLRRVGQSWQPSLSFLD